MHSRRTLRIVVATAVLAVSGLLTPAAANAIAGGTPVADGADRFAARITTEGRGCSGALISPEWVITAASCVPVNAQQPGVPAKPVTVIVGQANLRADGGNVRHVTAVVSRTDRDVALLKLAHPVADVTPLRIGTTAPTAAATLRLDGYGRSATEWMPDRLSTAPYTVDSATATTFALTSPAGNDPCLGDGGGPVFRQAGDQPELAGVATTSWQHGCLNVTETRQGSVAVRTDDIAGWISEQITPKSVRLVNKFTQRCVAVQGANNVNDAPAFQFDCPAAYDDQAWDIEPQASGGVLLRNQFTKKCLIVHAGNDANGAPAVQYDCLPQFGDQLWDLNTVNGSVQIQNRATKRCLVVFASTDANGAPAAMYDCLPQFSDQLWELKPVPERLQVHNRNSGRCLAVHGADNNNDAPAFQFDCTPPFADQAWDVETVATGGVLLRDHYTKRCLIVHAGSNTNGAPAVQYDCLPQFSDQLWNLNTVNGGIQIKNIATGRCLVAAAANNTNGEPVTQADCVATASDQIWDLLPFPNGS